MATNEMTVMLYACDGTTLVRHSVIGCSGEPPKLLEWDDPSEHGGRRTFIHEGGARYREHLSYLLSLGELWFVAAPTGSPAQGSK